MCGVLRLQWIAIKETRGGYTEEIECHLCHVVTAKDSYQGDVRGGTWKE